MHVRRWIYVAIIHHACRAVRREVVVKLFGPHVCAGFEHRDRNTRSRCEPWYICGVIEQLLRRDRWLVYIYGHANTLLLLAVNTYVFTGRL